MNPELWGLATALTLLAVRSHLAQQAKDLWLYPYLATFTTRRGKVIADNLEVLSRCAMCAGLWLTLLSAIILRSHLRDIPAAYVCTVLTIAAYDALSRIAGLLLDEN